MERVAQAEYDRLAHGLTHDDYLAQCGAYQSAARMVDLVDTLIAKAQEQHGRVDDTIKFAREHTKSVTLNTPYWRG